MGTVHCELSLHASEAIRAAPSIPAVTQGWPGHLSLGMPAPPTLLAQPRLPCPLPALGRALLPVTSRAQNLHWLPWTYITCPQGMKGKACWYHAEELCSRVAPSSGGCPWMEVYPGVPAV